MKLGVNIDHIATLRQQRKQGTPDPVEAAWVAQANGADSIVAHLREDRRHIQDDDLVRLKKTLKIPLAMEMAATDEMVRIACRLKPSRVCLVPEKRKELTTEGGLNIVDQRRSLLPKIQRLRKHKIEVSLFIDAAIDQTTCAASLGAEIVEFHTGRFALTNGAAREKELSRLKKASRHAQSLGLRLQAGHGLDYKNVMPVARIEGMEELNIGFAIITLAMFKGLGEAVGEMKQLIHS